MTRAVATGVFGMSYAQYKMWGLFARIRGF